MIAVRLPVATVLCLAGALVAQVPTKQTPPPAKAPGKATQEKKPPVIPKAKAKPKAEPKANPNAEPKQAKKPRPWATLNRYATPLSRRAFAACDADGDDRLDVRECLAALTNMGTIQKPTGFKVADKNRDGFLHWHEFDARYERIIRQGDPFRFRPLAPFAVPKPKRQSVDLAQKAVELVLKMGNTDDDPHINEAEFLKIVVALKQPPATAKFFSVLDLDRSGGLDATELGPVVAKIPLLLQLAAAASTKTAAAPTAVPKQAVLEQLGRMHPTLMRWRAKIFQSADKNGDGALSEKEITPDAKQRPKRNVQGAKK